MLSVEDWAEIRRLRRSEVSRNTVRAALASDGPPRYRRLPACSVVDGFEPRIRELLRAFPTMPATVIAERIDWPYSIRTLSGQVAELRQVYLPPDPASRTSYSAGEVAQCDFWFPDIELPVGFGQTRTAKQLPALTIVTGYARWDSAVLIPSRRAEDLFAGWWQQITALGAVPRVLVARAAPLPRGQARSGLERYLIQQAVRRPGYGPAHCMLTVRPTARLASASQLVDVDHQA